ncbi:MAG: hypothetical protein L6V95_13120 [Candidatus Melainabacteria bacterium]|nr:MAG: hypothetical protein L6V95_13120 [Candidatus Melainabacteria bacterium]
MNKFAQQDLQRKTTKEKDKTVCQSKFQMILKKSLKGNHIKFISKVFIGSETK